MLVPSPSPGGPIVVARQSAVSGSFSLCLPHRAEVRRPFGIRATAVVEKPQI
jgi:hypothetical protein